MHEHEHVYEYVYEYGGFERLERHRRAMRADTAHMLDFQKLDVYQRALDLLEDALLLADAVPRGHRSIADQLNRAALSVPLNIAEAVGRKPGPDRRRFLTIARGSAMECGALFDVIARLPRSRSRPTARTTELVYRVVSMLSRMGAAETS